MKCSKYSECRQGEEMRGCHEKDQEASRCEIFFTISKSTRSSLEIDSNRSASPPAAPPTSSAPESVLGLGEVKRSATKDCRIGVGLKFVRGIWEMNRGGEGVTCSNRTRSRAGLRSAAGDFEEGEVISWRLRSGCGGDASTLRRTVCRKSDVRQSPMSIRACRVQESRVVWLFELVEKLESETQPRSERAMQSMTHLSNT